MKFFNREELKKDDHKNKETQSTIAYKNRSERRKEARGNNKKGDETRKSTHKMRSHTGQKDYVEKVVDGFNSLQSIGGTDAENKEKVVKK